MIKIYKKNVEASLIIKPLTPLRLHLQVDPSSFFVSNDLTLQEMVNFLTQIST